MERQEEWRGPYFSQFAPMACVLRYGTSSSVTLEPRPGTLLAEFGRPQGEAIREVGQAVRRALNEPLDYPPLARGMTPGDRVVLALEPGLPQASEIVGAVVGCVVEAGVDPDGITVLQTRTDARRGASDPRAGLPLPWRRQVGWATHDPADRKQLAYLAALDSGEPLLLNRLLTEADVVLPIGAIGKPGALGYHGIHGAVYPTFSGQETQAKFYSAGVFHRDLAYRRHLLRECNEAGWLLGIQFTIQVIPGGGDTVLEVLAGQCDAVRRAGWERYRLAWGCAPRGRASLVVAAIEGNAGQQTWAQVGEALWVAARLAETGGAVALCCELQSPPGPVLQRLAARRSPRAALRALARHPCEEAWVAVQVCRALHHAHVYLLSRLDPTTVEALEMAPLADGAELARLVRRHASCIVLANAPHALLTRENWS